MLASMRVLAKGFVAKILMLFLVVSFGIWGVGDMVRNHGPSFAAKVGDETISPLQFEVQKQRIARQIQAMGVQNFDPNQLAEAILRQVVQQKLLIQSMKDLGLYVGDDLLASNVRRDMQFMDETGKFSATKFHGTLAGANITEGEFLQQLKAETAGKFLIASLDMADVVPPAPVLALEAAAAAETRDAVIVTVPAAATAALPSDEAIQQFYDANKDMLYRAPERRTVEYVMLAPADLSTIINNAITAEMVKEAAIDKPDATEEQLRASLRASERERVLHDLRGTIEDEMAAGSSLGEAVAKSGVKAQSILLKDVAAEDKSPRTNLEKAVIAQGFQLVEGDVSDLVTTPEGITFIASVKAVTSAAPKPLDAVKADVKTRVLEEARRETARTKVAEVKEALGKEPKWQTALAPFNLSTRTVADLKRLPEGKKSPSGIPDALHRAIFERSVGQAAGPWALPNGDQLLAIVTTSYFPPVEQKKPSAETIKPMIEQLNQATQNAAMNSFSTRHSVVVNPEILHPKAPQQ